MATEEYLDKIESLERNSQRIEKKEIPEKEDLPFTKLGSYIHLLPIVIELLEVIDKAEKNKHTKLWWMLYEVSVNSVTDLIVGYNKYHTQDKANLYNKARENISRIQALIIILTCLKQFEKESDYKLLQLLDGIIDSTNTEKGIPIGNLTSQLFANIYLNKLDEYIKYELKIKYYIRYMDDFVILHESKQELHQIKGQISFFLDSMKLTLHPKKANIFPISLGIDFLGYKIFSSYRLVRKSTVKRFLKKCKKKFKGYNSGTIEYDKLMESFNSWNAYMSHADSYALKNDLYHRYCML